MNKIIFAVSIILLTSINSFAAADSCDFVGNENAIGKILVKQFARNRVPTKLVISNGGDVIYGVDLILFFYVEYTNGESDMGDITLDQNCHTVGLRAANGRTSKIIGR